MATRTAPALSAALVAALLACAAAAAQASPARRLAQASVTCPDVKALEGNCPLLCTCVRNNSPNDPNAANCDALCQGCVSAASSCFDTPGAPLPEACSSYVDSVAPCLALGPPSGR